MIQRNAARGGLRIKHIARSINRRNDAIARPQSDGAGRLRNGVAGSALANLSDPIRIDGVGAQTDRSASRCSQVSIDVDISMCLK